MTTLLLSDKFITSTPPPPPHSILKILPHLASPSLSNFMDLSILLPPSLSSTPDNYYNSQTPSFLPCCKLLSMHTLTSPLTWALIFLQLLWWPILWILSNLSNDSHSYLHSDLSSEYRLNISSNSPSFSSNYLFNIFSKFLSNIFSNSWSDIIYNLKHICRLNNAFISVTPWYFWFCLKQITVRAQITLF